MDSLISYLGEVKLELVDQSGKVVDLRVGKNRIVTTGLALSMARLSGSGNALTHIGIGSGTTATTPADTALETQLARQVFDNPGGTLSTSVALYYATIPAGTGTGTVSEAGLFNASSGGTMFSRIVFSPMTKSAGLSLVVSWTVTAAQL